MREPLVQVMALIAHLMEEKGNFGPHLIVVPNAVLVNWRAEMTTWLPGVHRDACMLRLCGGKHARSFEPPICPT